MNPIHMYFVRHGQSTGNGKGEFGQDTDTELTLLGKSQAEKLANRFVADNTAFDKIVSSSYTRAAETARIIVKTLGYSDPIYMTSSLVEYSPGTWRGRKIDEVMNDAKQMMPVSNLAMWYKFPGGDSLFQVQRRASAYIEENIIYNQEMITLAEKQPVNVLVVSHGHTIRSLMQMIMGFDQSFIWKLDIDNTSICHVSYSELGWRVYSVNDTGHLR